MSDYLAAQIFGDLFNLFLLVMGGAAVAWWKSKAENGAATQTTLSDATLQARASALRFAIEDLKAFEWAVNQRDPSEIDLISPQIEASIRETLEFRVGSAAHYLEMHIADRKKTEAKR